MQTICHILKNIPQEMLTQDSESLTMDLHQTEQKESYNEQLKQ